MLRRERPLRLMSDLQEPQRVLIGRQRGWRQRQRLAADQNGNSDVGRNAQRFDIGEASSTVVCNLDELISHRWPNAVGYRWDAGCAVGVGKNGLQLVTRSLVVRRVEENETVDLRRISGGEAADEHAAP